MRYRVVACALLLATVPFAANRASSSNLTTLTGRLVVMHGDDFVHGRMVEQYALDTATRRVDLDLPPAIARLHGHHAGGQVRVTGTLSSSVLAVSSMTVLTDSTGSTSSTVLAPTLSWSQPPGVVSLHLGTSKIAVVLLSFADKPYAQTADQVRSATFTAPDSANAYLNEVSGGRIALTGTERSDGDVFGPYVLPSTYSAATCAFDAWAGFGKNAMTAAGHDPSRYNIIVTASPGANCPYGGLYNGSQVFVNGSVGLNVLTHELGHAYGLGHSGSYTCFDQAGNRVAISGSCQSAAYGDPFDIMGGGQIPRVSHYHAWNKYVIGLLPSDTTATATAGGTFTLTSSETSVAGTKQILRIPRERDASGNVVNWFTVELRQPYGAFDGAISPGLLVRIEPYFVASGTNNGSVSQLIDAHPATETFEDAPMTAGQTLSDPAYGVAIKAGAISGTAASVTVTLTTPVRPAVAVVNGVLQYRAGTGEENDATFNDQGGGTVEVTDVVPLSLTNATCEPENAEAALCHGVTSIDADLGDRDDTADVNGSVPAHLIGGAGNDNLTGGAGADTLDGGADNDQFFSPVVDGADTYIGGTGEDLVLYNDRTSRVTATIGAGNRDDGAPGEGDDIRGDVEDISGGRGADTLIGNGLANKLFGNNGDDFLEGGGGADVLSGGFDHDTVSYADHTTGVHASNDDVGDDGSPGEGDDVEGDVEVIIGSSGNDVLTVGSLDVTGLSLQGGPGDDILNTPFDTEPLAAGAFDFFDGGPGNDWISYAGRETPVTVHLAGAIAIANNGEAGENDYIANVENIEGGSSDDLLYGDDNANILRGGPGRDQLVGYGGVDTADYSDHTDGVTVNLPINAAYTDGNGSADNDRIFADVENATGGTAGDWLNGNDHNNVLNGGPGDDVLHGRGGNDTLIGGTGSDDFNGDSGNDTVSYQDHNQLVTVKLGDGVATVGNGAYLENDSIGPDVENVIGGMAGNRISGNSQANIIWVLGAHAGASISGGAGNDFIVGSDYADTILGGFGDDTLYGSGGNDTIVGDEATWSAQSGADTIDAGSGYDTIYAYDGRADTITCGDGYDSAHIDATTGVSDLGLTGCEAFVRNV
ncbi:MAG TPA: M66 family metalloprotease [Acidimicrobiia bacterium]|nr:M66 family metalloprotease [Acidimicrobiia bacterium]